MTGLLARLSKWDRYDHINKALEASGFRVPSLYRAIVSARARCDSTSATHRYWNEYAKEYVRSAGRTTIESRQFSQPGTYRSPFLDELADALTQTGETISKPPLWPLLPCLRAFEQARFDLVAPELLSEWKNTIDPRIALTNELETAKQDEIRTEDFSSIRTPITKRFQRELLFELGVGFGFRFERRAIAKDLNDRIELRLSRDVGGSATAAGLDIEAQPVATDDSTVVFPILWHKLSPGFQYYRVYKSSAACALGIRANLTIASAFADSL